MLGTETIKIIFSVRFLLFVAYPYTLKRSLGRISEKSLGSGKNLL